MVNSITISGKVLDIRFSHKAHMVNMYEMTIENVRLSGKVDRFTVFFDGRFDYEGEPYVIVTGDLREVSFGNESVAAIHAYKVEWKENEEERVNDVEIEGIIKRRSRIKYYKETPFIEIVIKCDRSNGYKSDFIPCIIWGADSLETFDAEYDSHILVTGRFQNKPHGTQVSARSIEWK